MSDHVVDLAAIASRRAAVSSLESDRAAVLRDRANLMAQRTAAARTGASAAALAALDQQISAADAKAGQLQNDLRDRLGQIGTIGQLDPTLLDPVSTLEGTVPVALIPARIETRYASGAAGRELRIRIHPDGLAIDQHDPGASAAELDTARAYWTTRFAAGGDAVAAWTALAGRYGAARAAWLVKLLTPTNLAVAGTAAPVFPEVEPRGTYGARPPRAMLLPTRWVAIGLPDKAGAPELFRKWGAFVPDTLSLGLSFDDTAEATPDPAAHELAIDPEVKWLIDYDGALAAGMAITIAAADVAGGHLPDLIPRLVVLGVDWTMAPAAGAATMAARLDGVALSAGLGFLTPGTATNNTGDQPAPPAFEEALCAALEPTRALPAFTADSAGRRLSAALGLGDAGASLDRLPGADLADAATTRALVDAIWAATGGYYLDQMWDPRVSDAMVSAARAFAADWLRPGGHLPLIRAGRQPFGILPVFAPGAWKPGATPLAGSVYQLAQQLRPYFTAGLADTPRLGDGRDLDDSLLALLQQRPWAERLRYRKALGPESNANTEGMEWVSVFQNGVFLNLIYHGFLATGGKGPPRISGFAVDPAPAGRELRMPFAIDPARGVAYIADIVAALAAGTAGRAALNTATNSGPLLQVLLALAALKELDHAGTSSVLEHLHQIGAVQSLPDKLTLRTAEQVFVQAAPAAAQNELVLQTPAELAATRIQPLTGTAPIADFVATRFQQALGNGVFVDWLGGLRRLKSGLDALGGHPAEEIDRCFRGLLDAQSHRMDAWYSALAAERLASVRKARPEGLYVGGWGYVEGLRRDTAPDSLGYMLAPSLQHGITACVLESARLAHAVESDAERFAVDLGPRRIRLARTLLEGVAAGQSLAALLGYRFERRLRELSLPLARFIYPLRGAFPLRGAAGSGSDAVPDQAAESVAASDVVDGVALIAAWRAKRDDVHKAVAGESPGSGEVTLLDQALGELDDALDAVGDALVAEAVHQMVLGNLDRAGAALSALDRQTAAHPLDVARSPRAGRAWSCRVLAVFDAAAPSGGWAVFNDARAQAEPRLNAWIADRLGRPERFVLSAALAAEDGTVEKIVLPIGALGLSALSLVWLSRPGGAARPTELEELIVAHVVATRPPMPAGMALTIEDGTPEGQEGLGFAVLHAALQTLFGLVSSARYAQARDLAPPSALAAAGVDLAELTARAQAAGAALRAALTQCTAARGGDAAMRRAAMLEAVGVGQSEAIPVEAGDGLAAQLETVIAALTPRVAALDAAEAAALPDELQSAEESLIARLRLVFGQGFPVLPGFRAAAGAELAAALEDQGAATGGDAFAADAFLARAASVRPNCAALADVLDAAALLGLDPGGGGLSLVQLPHQPGATWVGLDGQAEVEAALLVAGRFDPNAVLAGLAVDAWNDAVPAEIETGSAAFQYDAPEARAPQSLVLAVPPDPALARWSLDLLRDTVLEAVDLAKLRTIDPSRIRVLTGNMLPALFVPEDLSGREPSIRFAHLAASVQLSQVQLRVLGR